MHGFCKERAPIDRQVQSAAVYEESRKVLVYPFLADSCALFQLVFHAGARVCLSPFPAKHQGCPWHPPHVGGGGFAD